MILDAALTAWHVVLVVGCLAGAPARILRWAWTAGRAYLDEPVPVRGTAVGRNDLR